MRRDLSLRWLGAVVLAATVLASSSAATAATGSAVSAAACGSWAIVASQNAGTHPSTLDGVAAVSASEAYAVGSSFDADAGVYHTLIERWTGSRWKRMSSPDPGDTTNSLGAAAAVAPGDVWAVGITVDGGSGFDTLTEHLSGGSWTVMPSPSPGDRESDLMDVAAFGPGDVWAVGFQSDGGGPRRTLAEHWNGSVWKAVKTPSVGSDDNILYGVTAIAPNDVWAVGAYSVPWFQTLVLHWNGSRWKVVTSPNVGDGDNIVYDVAPTGTAGELRAVGSAFDDQGDTVPLALRWNGSTWKETSIPGPVPGFDALFGVAAASPGDLWAVGDQGGFGAPFRTLAEHWDGSAWAVEPTPNRGGHDNHLYDVAHVPGTGGFWAVGTSTASGGGQRTLIERLDC